MHTAPTGFDVIVLGGGVAGCVLAARLSEDPDRTVCLVEAGPDYGPEEQAWPPKIRNARALTRDDVWERHAAPHRVRARVLGGSSCINGCWNTWGCDADHAEWATAGGPAWSTEGLEPFRRAAAAQMGMRQVPVHELSAWSLGAQAAARDLGYPEIDPGSAPVGAGYGSPLMNAVDGVRRNAAFGYLTRARSRPNLSIVGGAAVDRLVLRDGAVRGVEIHVDGAGTTLVADTYLLACGTFGSPAVLLRSGVGPAGHLTDLGVTVQVDLPGVGANLADQPGVFTPLAPTPELNAALAAKDADGDLYVSRVLVRAASSYCADGAWDLHILPTAGPPLFGRLPPGQYEAGISAFLMKPVSRGAVRLRSTDHAAELDIDPAFLSDPDGRDLAVLREGLRIAWETAARPALATLASPTGPPPHELPDDELRGRVGTYWHPVGTCAMGADDDPLAVVDPVGRVRGVSNLRVVDASILPTIPAANTQLPVLAVAEMLAAAMRP